MIVIDGNEFDENDLIRHAILSLKGPGKYRSKYGIERWILVKDLFGVGSTVACGLCRKYGFDPYEDLRS